MYITDIRPEWGQELYPEQNVEDYSLAWQALPIPVRILFGQCKYGNACHNSLHMFPEPANHHTKIQTMTNCAG